MYDGKFLAANRMEEVLTDGQMGMCTMVSGTKVKSMEVEFLHGQTAICTLASGKITKRTEEVF